MSYVVVPGRRVPICTYVLGSWGGKHEVVYPLLCRYRPCALRAYVRSDLSALSSLCGSCRQHWCDVCLG